jgi:hypothetical protein
MSRRINLLLLILVTGISTAICQSNFGTRDKGIEVYPMRVNHKYGYAKFFRVGNTVIADTMVSPKYDYIGDVNLPWNILGDKELASPYRLYELDERVGLLDPNLNELLPNDFKRIRPVTPGFFAVEVDSLFQLMSVSTRQMLFDGQAYDNILLADTLSNGHAYFLVKRGLHWGLNSEGGDELFSPRFIDIQKAGAKGYFKVREQASDEGWFAVDTLGRKLLPEPYADVMVFDENLMAYQDKGKWILLAKEATQARKHFKPKGELYEHVETINDRLALLVTLKPRSVQLWDIKEQKKLRGYLDVEMRASGNTPRDDESGRENLYYPWFFPLDEEYIIFCEKGTTSGYIDRLMNNEGELKSPAFSLIKPSGKEGMYKVKRFGAWGMLAPRQGSGLLLECIFKDISDFSGPYALLTYANAYGVLGVRNNRIDTLDWVFDKVSLLEGSDTLYVQLSNQTIKYTLNEQGQFTPNGIFDNLSIVSRNTGVIQEAFPIEKPMAERYKPNDGIAGDLILKKEGEFVTLSKMYKVERERGGFDMVEDWAVELPVKDRPRRITELKAGEVVAYPRIELGVEQPMMRRFFDATVAPISFYNLKTQKYLKTPTILGMRDFDQDYNYTTFIDENGEMGLINREGQECMTNGQPVRYTFIGPFIAGRARVCKGGKLVLVSSDEKDIAVPYKYKLTYPFAMGSEFNISIAEEKANQDQARSGMIFAYDQPGSPCEWGYIDGNGQFVLDVDADYVKDFHHIDSTAFILRKNKRKDAYGHPDADYGIINFHGEEILPTDYSQILNLQDYYYVAVDSTPTFFFTQKGHEIFVNPTRLRPFSEGLAQFRGANNLWGYVDSTGRVIMPPQFLNARPFSDGMALVADSTGQCSYVLRDGTVAFTTPFKARQWRGIGDFHEGRAWFKEKGWSWGAFDKHGETVIPAKYYHKIQGASLPKKDEAYPLPMDFSQGVAAVATYSSNNTTVATIIDTSGQKILKDSKLAFIGPFDEEGVAVYAKQTGGLRGLINKKGELISPDIFRIIDHFKENVAKVKTDDGMWGLIDRTGRVLITPKYYLLGEPSEGLVSVKEGKYGEWSYVDYRGRMVIEGPFSQAAPFKGGVTFVRKDDERMIINKVGIRVTTREGEPAFFAEGIFGIKEESKKGSAFYADASGNNVFGRNFAEISPFQLGVAKVRRLEQKEGRRELLGAINKRGVMIVPPKYRMLHIQPDGNIIINPQRFYGVVSKKGDILIDPIYDRIEQFAEEGLYRVERGEKIGYIILKGDQALDVWPLGY